MLPPLLGVVRRRGGKKAEEQEAQNDPSKWPGTQPSVDLRIIEESKYTHRTRQHCKVIMRIHILVRLYFVFFCS